MSHNKNIADYYNQTINHYTNWWKLKDNLSVHYGIWNNNTRNFKESLGNTNEVVAKIAQVSDNEKILDAGCGVGGSSYYLAKKYNAEVNGITLSNKQVVMATEAGRRFPNLKVSFSIQDYCHTNFKDEHFDLIWAIESITSAPDKMEFAKEAYRLLKPGGRLVIADYFKTSNEIEDPNNLLEKWRELWSMAPFLELDEYIEIFSSSGFGVSQYIDFTSGIVPTAKRMYYSYLLGGPFAVLYNLFNTPTPFARNHYKSGLYQYKALKYGLWKYLVIRFNKPV